MADNNKLYESVHNYTKFKLVEMIIDKYKDKQIDNLNQIEEIKTGEEESNNETIDYQEDNYLFEKPIEVDSDNENIIRRENLKKYNHVFKSNNSSIEDLEKIPAYKRMGIEINNSKSEGDEIFSKTILNEENKLEFPDVNTYLHDNVD